MALLLAFAYFEAYRESLGIEPSGPIPLTLAFFRAYGIYSFAFNTRETHTLLTPRYRDNLA